MPDRRDIREGHGAGQIPSGPNVCRRVVVYRDSWLPLSEGFVIEPTRHFLRYETVPVGLSLTDQVHPLVAPSDVRLIQHAVTSRELCRLRARGFRGTDLRLALGGAVGLVHAHFAPDALVARHLARGLGVPLVVTLHGYDVTTPDRDFLRTDLGRSYLRLRPRLQRSAALFLPVSEFLREQMLLRGWPAERTVTHHLGVDTDYWRPEASTSRSDVLFVGRLIALKGASFALEAFRSVAHDFPGSRLHIVGDGPDRTEVESAANPLGDRVVFHGAQPRDYVREISRRCGVVLVASHLARGRRDALNLVTLEAAASALPVVGFASGGVPEVVEHGVTGLLAPEKDVPSLAAHLRSVLGDEALARRLGSNARDRCVRLFSMKNQASRLECIYDEMLAR